MRPLLALIQEQRVPQHQQHLVEEACASLAEAVGDVPVDEVQLTKLVYTIVYRRTLDAVIKRCTRGADRQWLGLLMLRTPMTSKADENQWPLSVETWLGSAASDAGLPKEFSWTKPPPGYGKVVGPVHNQQDICASCWAFVTADSIAGRWAVINKGQDIEEMSVKQLMV